MSSVATPEPPILERLRRRFFGRSKTGAGAAFIEAVPAPSFRLAKKSALLMYYAYIPRNL